MNQQERDNIAQQWALVAAIHGKDLTVPLLRMMVDAVEDLPFPAVLSALKSWIKTSKHQRHPSPAEVREIAAPTASNDSLAREAAARIPEAIRRHGYNHPDDARKFIGEAGWSAIQRFGGWEYICQHHGTSDMNPQTFYAQSRDLIRAHLELSETGHFGKAIGLPEPKLNQGLQSMGDIMGLLPERST